MIRLIIIFLLLPFVVLSQLSFEHEVKLKDLALIIANAHHDSVIVDAWMQWDDIIYLTDPPMDLILNQKIDSLCSVNLLKKQDEKSVKFFSKSKAYALNNLGLIQYDKGNYSKAILYHQESLEIDIAFGNQKGLANSYMNIGNNYYIQGHYSDAITFYTKALKIHEKLTNKTGMANTLMNIGNIYHLQKNYVQSINYYIQSLELREGINDTLGMAGSFNNIGGVYVDQEDYKTANEYYLKCLNLRKSLGDKQGTASVLGNIGSVHKAQGNFKLAMDNYSESLKIKEELGDKLGIAATLKSIAGLYLDKGDFMKALEYSSQSLKIAREIGVAVEIRDASQTFYKSSKATGDYRTALEMYELYVATRDSMESEENQKAIIHQEYKYQYEKQAAADSVKAAEAGKVKDAQIAAQTAQAEKSQLEADQRNQQQKIMYGGIGILIVFGFFMWDRFRKSQKQNRIIADQKAVVESQKNEVELAHEQLAEHHQEIADSIKYAKRIQDAIMPSINDMDAALKQCFVLYLPKDIVAGDFIWMEQIDDVVYFAAADCTGHGVPGAMVSVICSNALSKALLEDGVRNTGLLLDRTREIVIDRLARSGEEVKDGMDISLCALNMKSLRLEWSGANNPLWILRLGVLEVEEIKADKQPIGKYAKQEPYTTHQVQLSQGDTIYVFTDGYQDQFGGPRGKKYKPVQLKQLLTSVSQSPMMHQKMMIEGKFQDWKGGAEQLDDVCLIGVRV